jgi:hypothetical protein
LWVIEVQAEKLCTELENALVRLGWKIRYERGDFRGGECLLSGERMVIINRRLNVEDKIEIFARALVNAELDSLYLLPEVREFLEMRSESWDREKAPPK